MHCLRHIQDSLHLLGLRSSLCDLLWLSGLCDSILNPEESQETTPAAGIVKRRVRYNHRNDWHTCSDLIGRKSNFANMVMLPKLVILSTEILGRSVGR